MGEDDTVMPLAQGEAAAALVSDVHLLVMSKAGHVPQIEVPGLFEKELLEGVEVIEKNDVTCD
ncbi:MAG: hypothetical protein P8I56_07130 [Paracoccaceae bacterium]|jgi:pimeloyl-ACP methyl ester carboxylesterase|nr:hypothetical protein [Paracoccaceae bacterium]